MPRLARTLFAALGLFAGLGSGCAFDMENRSSQRITVDPWNALYGEPVVSPTNDARSWNGEPMDYRRR